MPQVIDRPTTGVRPAEQRIRPVPVTPPTSPFMRWLGWLLVSALLLGGAGLIWYGIANDNAEPAAVAAAPVLADIDPYENPEVVTSSGLFLVAPALDAINPHESPEVSRIDPTFDPYADRASRRVPGLVLVTPAIEAIDPHESPEIMRVTVPDPFANPRIP